MEIAIMKSTDYVSSSGIVEDVQLYDNTKFRTFTQGEILRSDNKVFVRTGNDLTPTVYDSGDEADYVLNQVIWKDNVIQYVSAPNGVEVRKQPEEYTTLPPESLQYGTWGHRYAKLGTLDTSTNSWVGYSTDGTKHEVYWDGSDWRYRVSAEVDEYYWANEEYTKDVTSIKYTDNPPTEDGDDDDILWKYSNTNVYAEAGTAQEPTPYQTIVSGSDGNRYRCGQRNETLNQGGGLYYLYFAIQQERTRTAYSIISNKIIDMFTESSEENTEYKAYCLSSTNCENQWSASTIIRRGNDLYVRTNTDDSAETETTTSAKYAELETLEQANGWGWTYDRPSNNFAPLDGKKYTYVSTPNDVTYTVSSAETFDTIAINGLIAREVTFIFTPDSGAPIDPVTIIPNSNMDIDSRLPPAPTTVICYIPIDITGSVQINFKTLEGSVRIGGIALGQSVNAGFTNLTFTNKFKDYSPYEKDQWGNILYIEGVKTNIYTGTVDVELTSYDMINRLMSYIGGNVVILNGSDTKDNSPVDNLHFFASTMLVGRIRNFALKTRLDNKKLAQMATYNFEIEEQV